MTGVYERLSDHDIQLLVEAIENRDGGQARVERLSGLKKLLREADEIVVLSRVVPTPASSPVTRGTASIEEDATKLVGYLRTHGFEEAGEVYPTWDHMGAIIVDAVLQANRNYDSMVYPRVEKIRSQYQTADTVSGFLDLASKIDLKELLDYSEQARIDRMVDVAETFRAQGIETVEDLRSRLQGPEDRRESVRVALYAIFGVGPKTVDYFDLLVGSSTGLAVDLRVKRVLSLAGITILNYEHCADVMREAADRLGWTPRELDALLWRIGASNEE